MSQSRIAKQRSRLKATVVKRDHYGRDTQSIGNSGESGSTVSDSRENDSVNHPVAVDAVELLQQLELQDG